MRKYKFEKTTCSQCGGSFGPGDSGYSHCEDHAQVKKETKGIRLPLWMWDWLDGQDDARGVIVEDAIKKVHKLKTPQRGEQSK